MIIEEFKKLKPGDMVVISGPRNINNGKMGIVRFIQINELGSGTVYLEPYNCNFEVSRTTPVLRGEIVIYGFIRQQISNVREIYIHYNERDASLLQTYRSET